MTDSGLELAARLMGVSKAKAKAWLLAPRRHEQPEYLCWSSMKARCTNPNLKGYPYYGGRGITVCDRWMRSFDAFLADVGPRPGPEYSLDRIDNDGNYERGNVRWATRSEQARNRRRPMARIA